MRFIFLMGDDIAFTYLAGAAAALVVAYWICSYIRAPRRPGLRPLPGPSGYPAIGNVLDIPAEDGHIAYSRLARRYGPIMQFNVLGKTIIVISDLKIALDLFEKRGAIYSGRPNFYMAWESGFTWPLAFMPQNDAWRVRRQLMHHKFHPQATMQMHGLLRRTAIELARNLLHTPHRFRDHIKHSAASSIMRAVYGIVIEAEGDPYAEIAENAMEAIAVIVPGNLMDVIPLLRYVPAWVPVLGSWTAQAHSMRKHASALLEVPYAHAKADMRMGTARPCMVHEALDRLQTDPSITEEAIKDACAVSYFGGADTTICTLASFIMAMVMWPECQKKAQAELDRVLGERLPDLADQQCLPYIEAIVRETYRRYPAGPLGVPHAVDENNEYNGYFIRKGSTVVVNVWDIMHDSEMYPEPERFNPDRWLKDGAVNNGLQDPRIANFGFGRRICPGRYFADASIFLTIAIVLKCFNLGYHIEDGVEIPPSGRIETGLTSCPAPFKCKITPRSAKIGGLIDVALDTCVD